MNISLTIDGVAYTVTPTVVPPPPSGLFLLPAGVNPTVVNLDALVWQGTKDAATSGIATFATTYPLAISGKQARQFSTSYTNHAGVRFSCRYADGDTTSTHFIYAGELWIDDPTQIAQMELDNNQVTADGKTYIFGVQANANDGFWDITEMNPGSHWTPTTLKVNPRTWPAKTWIHFEIMSHRDNAGKVTYDAIYFNGVTMQIGKTLASAENIGWTIGRLLVNWQLGGAWAAGSILTYGSGLVVAKW